MPEPGFHPAKVGIVTVTYNSESVIPEFMTSLLSQRHSNFRLFAIDNASSDASIPAMRARPDDRVTIIANPDNRGVAEGNNQGIRAALAEGCDFVLLLNNDTVFGPELLAALVAGMDRFQFDMAAPKMLYHDEPGRLWAAGGAFQPWLGYRIRHHGKDQLDRGQFDAGRVVTYVPTCCLLMRSDVIRRVGLMDPEYFVYFDDVDFMYRAMRAGVTLGYLPEATLLHKVSACTGGAATAFARSYSARNRAYFLRKHLSLPFWAACSLLYLAYYLALRLVGRDDAGAWRLKAASFVLGLRMAGDLTPALPQGRLDGE
ncbi:MAG TPA: glycosyltransferase family 2 protein [Paludibaculum sp.]|jgi:hypothetical protein